MGNPLNYAGYTVTTIEDPELGQFHYDRVHGFFEWDSPDRVDALCVPADKLTKFLSRADEILGILGVDPHECDGDG